MYTPVNPSFIIWKWGLWGSKLYRHVFVMSSVLIYFLSLNILYWVPIFCGWIFYQICRDTLLGHYKNMFRLWWPWLKFQGHSSRKTENSATLSCLYNMFWINCWNLNIFSWIHNWDITKNWSDFGDFDLMFKVTAVEKLKIYGWGHLFSLKTLLLV